MSETIHHTHSPLLGGFLLEVERNSRSVTLRVRVDRPRQDGESFEDAAEAALRLAKATYERAREEFPQPPPEAKS